MPEQAGKLAGARGVRSAMRAAPLLKCNSKCMYVFGGFKQGERTNEVLIYHFEYN